MYGPARRSWLLPLLLALPIAACAPGRTVFSSTAGQPVLSRPVLAPAPDEPVGADRLLPLPDGPDAFQAIQETLRGAARSIHLEMYEFQRPDLAGLIQAAVARGVAVTAIMDPSERSSQALWQRLQAAGVDVVAFPVERRTIDHVKLLVVDGRVAIMGGINWGRHSQFNRDYDVLASGPVVSNLERIFQQDLALAGRAAVIPDLSFDPLVQVLVTRPGEAIRYAVLEAIGAARRTIDVEAFVLSDRLVLTALLDAAHRGVKVRVLLEPSQPQNPGTLLVLQAAGAQARLFPGRAGQLLHAKLGIFDAATVIFGSCNWSRSGFTRNHELDLAIQNAGFAQVFLRALEADWAAAN